MYMLRKCCNGNPASTFPPYYGFHTFTKLFKRPGVAGAVLQTPQKDSLRIQLWGVSYNALLGVSYCGMMSYSAYLCPVVPSLPSHHPHLGSSATLICGSLYPPPIRDVLSCSAVQDTAVQCPASCVSLTCLIEM